MSNIIHTVIYLPLKILITSLVLSLTFDRIIYKDFYIHDPADCHKTHLFGNVEHLTNVIEERMKPEYKPMNDSVHKMYQEKKLRIIKWRATMDFVFFILFVIVLCKILNKDNLLPYFTNDHLHSMLGASGDKNLPSFNAVYNLTQFDKFLKQSFSLSLSKFFWYNKKHIQEGRKNQEKKDWCFDNTHRMLRRPHFTLSRVKPGHCQVPGVMQTVSGALECAAPWDRTAEDTQVYKPYWTLPEHLDNTSYWNPGNWSYTHYSNYNHCGRSGRCYPSGGYNRSLWSEARVVLSVRDEGWMDHFTRALLIHLTLCNVNTRRIVPVTLVAEQSVTGEFLNVIVLRMKIVDLGNGYTKSTRREWNLVNIIMPDLRKDEKSFYIYF
ncbi:uncharacterized protein LOC128992941 [Macrosteles quadrilineatus]|uniref:uncharacterized protein LOC128992941 n=1 Tax=Macrosteles quadrilineatus TaxID=74068 RepID=UPI0023E3047A|nr:uncharacterized protein LOC128992941 [Macrosteles quadrilineatus]